MLRDRGVVKNREGFGEKVKAAFKQAKVTVPTSLFGRILLAVAERGETADVCSHAKENVDPDPALRDYENVPLKEDVDAYMKREVLPHVPDAWVDESKTEEVVGAIVKGQVIEPYLTDRPLPNCLLLHMGEQPLHVVAAVDVEAGIGYVITAYRPDLEHFEADYKTRRRT